MANKDSVDISDFGMEGQVPFVNLADKAQKVLEEQVEEQKGDEDIEEEEELDDDSDDDLDDEGLEDEREDDEEEHEEDDEEEGEYEEDDEGEEDDEEEEGEPSVVAKSYKITMPDGTQAAVTDEGTIKIKENGKFVRIKLRDLVSDRNGRIKNDELIRRRSEEVKNLQYNIQALKARDATTSELVKSFSDGITGGDVIKAMGVIGEMSGVSGEKIPEFIMQSLQGMMTGIQGLAQKDEDQITREAEAYRTNSELAKQKRELGSIKTEKARERAIQDKKRVSKALNVSEDDMKAAYNALASRNEELKQAGHQEQPITMEAIGELVVDSVLDLGFRELAEKNNIEVTADDRENLIQLGRVARKRKGNKDLTQKEYRRLLSNYANKELKGLSRNLGDGSSKRRSKKSTPKRQDKRGTRNKGKLKEITRLSEAWPI